MNEFLPAPPEDIALPVYKKIVYKLTEESPPKDYLPGRIVNSGHWIDGHDPEFVEGDYMDLGVIEASGPNDIVNVALYAGHCERAGEGTSQPGRFYDHNFDILREIAPRVKAVLIGNAGPELAFKHFWWRDPSRGMVYASEKAAEFVREVGRLVIAAGGRPAFGTMDWDLGIDCYQAHGLLREAIIEVGAIQVCFCGWKLLTGEMHGAYYGQVQPPEVGGFDENGEWVDTPILHQYLEGTETVGGVGHWQGLRAGNDVLLKRAGFVAGSLGVA